MDTSALVNVVDAAGILAPKESVVAKNVMACKVVLERLCVHEIIMVRQLCLGFSLFVLFAGQHHSYCVLIYTAHKRTGFVSNY